MSGSQRQLFSNAPIVPAAPVLPAVAPGSSLAAAMMQSHPLSLPSPSMGSVPLGSLMSMVNNNTPQPGSGATSSTPNLAWNPNNPVGTDTLGGNTANQGSWAGNAAAAYLPGYQSSVAPAAQAPGTPSSGAPGMPSAGSPGMPTTAMPGMPSPDSVGTAAPGSVGPAGQMAAWFQSLYGGGNGG